MATANKVEAVQEKKPNIFVRMGRSIANSFKKLGNSIGEFFGSFGRMFKNGSWGTKLSFLIFGAGSFSHKQIIKGILFLGLQALFFAYMIMCPAVVGPGGVLVPTGWKSLANLALGGTEGGFNPETLVIDPPSNSQLMLLFGLVTIAIIILYLIIWRANIKSSYIADTAVKEGKKPTTFVEDIKALGDNRFHILMLTPTCLAALVFTLLPTIFMICMAFTTYNILDMQSANTALFHWNGVHNFGYMFSGEGALGYEISNRFFPVLGWTVIWAIFATFTCYFGGIILALLINKKGLKGKKVFRTIFVLTIAIPQFISLLAMRNLLSNAGPINNLIVNVFHWSSTPISFLGLESTGNNVYLARVMVIVINMWLGIPYTMLMTSGILMNIPEDLYEAAKVDGTGTFKMFFKITFPYIFFITTPYLISSFIGNINSFNTIFLLTGGGPSVGSFKAGETDLLVTWLYKLTIENGEYNTGAVIGILTFLITATITLITYRHSNAYKEEDTFQ